MKIKFFLPFLMSLCAANAAEVYNGRIVHVLEQLRHCRSSVGDMPEVGGAYYGFPGSPHAFYLLFPYVYKFATDADLVAMCKDSDAVVRVMAAKCIVARTKTDAQITSALNELLKDKTEVVVYPFGCEGEGMTVAEIVIELKKDSDFLGPLKKPNQRPDRNAGAASPSTSASTPGVANP